MQFVPSVNDPPGTSPDRALADILVALGSPTRLAILRQLRTPRTIREIRVSPESPLPGERADRSISRQAIHDHLVKLQEIGAVVTTSAERDPGEAREYLLNHQKLFAIVEEIRKIAELRPLLDPRLGETMAHGPAAPKTSDPGPVLLLVRGLREGHAFPLALPGGAGPPEWVIGRRRGLPVALDYDPFVSTENSIVRFREGTYEIEDLAESRNGTMLNFRSLSKGKPSPLAHGDVIGVGRSLLLFRTA